MEKANAHYFQDARGDGKLSFTFYVCGAGYFLHKNSPGEMEKHTSVLREALSTYFIAKNPYI
jgi:hypothetical protein